MTTEERAVVLPSAARKSVTILGSTGSVGCQTIDLLERAAVLLQEWENIEEAAQFFRRAHDIRKEIERKQFEGDQKMSEVPRVTLTTG